MAKQAINFQVEFDGINNAIFVDYTIVDTDDPELKKRVRYQLGKYGSDPAILTPNDAVTYDLFTSTENTQTLFELAATACSLREGFGGFSIDVF